jgi:quinol monooxygenase YgiN
MAGRQTEAMIVVQGVFQVAPEDRTRYLTESLDTQRISRAEAGCLEYVLAADPVEPDRVVLSERWATRADLDAHLKALMARREAEAEAGATPITPLHRDVSFFEANETSLM